MARSATGTAVGASAIFQFLVIAVLSDSIPTPQHEAVSPELAATVHQLVACVGVTS